MPDAATWDQSMAAPPGCWNDATSTPCSSPAMAAEASAAGPISPVPVSGAFRDRPRSWLSSSGECVAPTLARSPGLAELADLTDLAELAAPAGLAPGRAQPD